MDTDYDEEHLVESSSSEPSPREQLQHFESQSSSTLPVYPNTNRNMYSRHYQPPSSYSGCGTQAINRSATTSVDTGQYVAAKIIFLSLPVGNVDG